MIRLALAALAKSRANEQSSGRAWRQKFQVDTVVFVQDENSEPGYFAFSDLDPELAAGFAAGLVRAHRATARKTTALVAQTRPARAAAQVPRSTCAVCWVS